MERKTGFYRVNLNNFWTVAKYFEATSERREFWSTSEGNMCFEDFDAVDDQRIPMPDDEPAPEAAVVKCVNCKWGDFQRTDSGRIKKKLAGRCQAVVDVEFPVLLCSDAPKIFFKQGIWPDTEGRCDFYAGV